MMANSIFIPLAIFALVHFSVVKPDGAGHDWDYGRSFGRLAPDQWFKNYPSCGGKQQSPIEIVDSAIETDKKLQPLRFINYAQELDDLVMINDGHTLRVNIPQKYNISIKGTSLPATYRLSQFHFHWPSEHMINGVRYPLELHLVHTNTDLPDTKVQTDPTGLVVVAVMFDYKRMYGPRPSVSLTALTDRIAETSLQGQNVTLDIPIILEDLLPAIKTSYIRYSGSLTTPPCSEVIQFHLLTNIVPISHQDANSFLSCRHEVLRKTMRSDSSNETVGVQKSDATIHNARPLQPLNGRVLRMFGNLGDFPTDL